LKFEIDDPLRIEDRWIFDRTIEGMLALDIVLNRKSSILNHRFAMDHQFQISNHQSD